MIFNSTAFLVFFLLFFNLYWLINNRCSPGWRNAFIVLSSYVFYGWWDWRFLGLIAVNSLADYSIGLYLERVQAPRTRKLLLFLSIAVNLGILGFFKYFNFFVDSLQAILAAFDIPWYTRTLDIILPVGISFYTFQTLSYTIDVYRRQLKPTQNLVAFLAFVSFFPQLVAGPIERASRLLGQLK